MHYFNSKYPSQGTGSGQVQSNTECCSCGGLVLEQGKTYGYVGKVCHCAHKTPLMLQTGWICPKCNSGVSPFKDKCGC